MEIQALCASYFKGFKEISKARENEAKVNAYAVIKILTYCTLIIPIAVALVFGASILCERVSPVSSPNSCYYNAKEGRLSSSSSEAEEEENVEEAEEGQSSAGGVEDADEYRDGESSSDSES